MTGQRGISTLGAVGLVAVAIVVLILVLKMVTAIATALFWPILLIGIGVAIGAMVVSGKGKRRA